jgi:hypothetical protein
VELRHAKKIVGMFKAVSKMIAAIHCAAKEAAKTAAKVIPRFWMEAPEGAEFTIAETRIAENAGPKLAIRSIKAKAAVLGGTNMGERNHAVHEIKNETRKNDVVG